MDVKAEEVNEGPEGIPAPRFVIVKRPNEEPQLSAPQPKLPRPMG
jgi:hypothetical protein